MTVFVIAVIFYLLIAAVLAGVWYHEDCEQYGDAFADVRLADNVKSGLWWGISVPTAIIIFIIAAIKASR